MLKTGTVIAVHGVRRSKNTNICLGFPSVIFLEKRVNAPFVLIFLLVWVAWPSCSASPAVEPAPQSEEVGKSQQVSRDQRSSKRGPPVLASVMSRHLTYYIFQEFLSEAFEQFSHSEIGLSEKLAHVTGIPSLSTQFHKNALTKALMLWRIELLRLERSGNLIDLSEFTHFRFLEAALSSEVEKRLWRSYLGYDQNGVVNSNSSISPAFSDFVLSEALPSAELRYNRILNICKTEVRSTGRFRKSCRHIASWMLTSNVLKVRQIFFAFVLRA